MTAPARGDAAQPAQLVVLLLDGALAAVERAVAGLATAGPAGIDAAHRELTRAQDLILELQLSVDHNADAEVAQSLDALYAFCFERLVAANLAKDPEPLAAASRILAHLRESWHQAIATARTEA